MLKSLFFFIIIILKLKVINYISFSNALTSNELQGTPAWETTHPADLAIGILLRGHWVGNQSSAKSV